MVKAQNKTLEEVEEIQENNEDISKNLAKIQERENRKNAADHIVTNLQLFPLFNILNMRLILNRLVKKIDLPYESKIIKWRINTTSFINVFVENIY